MPFDLKASFTVCKLNVQAAFFAASWPSIGAEVHSGPGPVTLVTCEQQPAVDNNVLFICPHHIIMANPKWPSWCIIALLHIKYSLGDYDCLS